MAKKSKSKKKTFKRSRKKYAPKTISLGRQLTPDTLIWVGAYTRRMNLTYNGYYYCGKGFRMNNAYDPDSTTANQGITGFDKHAQFYAKYRVLSNKAVLNIANNENFPVEFTIFPSTEYQVDNSTWFANILPADLPYARTVILGAKGGQDRARIKCTMPISKIYGRKHLDFTFDGRCDGNTTPINSCYWYICARTIKDGQGLGSDGVSVVAVFDYKMMLYEPLTLAKYTAITDKFDTYNYNMGSDDVGLGAVGATGYVTYNAGATGI